MSGKRETEENKNGDISSGESRLGRRTASEVIETRRAIRIKIVIAVIAVVIVSMVILLSDEKVNANIGITEIGASLIDIEEKLLELESEDIEKIELIKTTFGNAYELYGTVSTNVFMERFNIYEDIINLMDVNKDGGGIRTSSIWGSTVINSMAIELKIFNDSIEKLNNEKSFAKDEKEILNITNNMINYFYSNQKMINELFVKYEIISKAGNNKEPLYLKDTVDEIIKTNILAYKTQFNRLSELRVPGFEKVSE